MNVCSSIQSRKKLIWIKKPLILLKESWKKLDKDQPQSLLKKSWHLNIKEQAIIRLDNLFKTIN